MTLELKPISKEAIPAALEKAMRYRLLNEPGQAESICLDVLRVDPANQQALVMLLLAVTDRFGKDYAISETQADEVVSRLADPYERAYFSGIICERKGKATLARGRPWAGFEAHDWFREALSWYEKAEALRPSGNDDAILHWNACARIISRNHLEPRPKDETEPALE